MAINHPQWIEGTAAQRLISVAKLNQLADDAVNVTDDIHPQYGIPIFQSRAFHNFGFQVTAGLLPVTFDYHNIECASVISQERYPTSASGYYTSMLLARLQYLYKTALYHPTQFSVSIKAGKTGSSSIYLLGFVLVNGVCVTDFSTEITTAYPSYGTINHTLNLGSLSLNDIIEAYVTVACSPSGANYAYLKDIDIYFN